MDEYNGLWHTSRAKVLTGEPLEWQLTNTQRERIGLPPVEDSWTLAEVPCGLLADRETYIYTDDLRVMRVISSGENSYEECCVDAVLTEDNRIAPAKEGAKSIPLTAANLHKRRKLGMSLFFEAHPGGSVIRVEDHTAGRMLLDLHSCEGALPRDIPGLARWLDEWCAK